MSFIFLETITIIEKLSFFLQILCLAEQIRFSENCEAAIKGGSLMAYGREVEGQLESYTGVDLGGAGGGDEETAVLDLKLKALILDTIHNMDVIHHLLKANVRSSAEWIWQKQLRYMQHLTHSPI